MFFLKQSTASQSVVIGPFVDSTDGNTAETGLTIANTDIRLSKNGANIVAKNSGGGTHDELGYYTITLDATDTDTVGRLQVMVHASGALPVYHEFQVLEEAVFDQLMGASALGYIANAPVNVAQVSGDSTAADNLEAVLDGTGGVTLVASAITLTTPITANATQISGDSTAADNLETAFDDTAGAVRWMGIVDQGTAQSATATTLVLRSAAAFADDELIGATIQITGGTTGVGQSRTITDYVSATDTATVDTWTTTPSGTITYKIYGTAAGAGGSAPTAAQIADAVWDEAQADHVAAGSFGEVATEVAAILVDTGTTLDGKIDTIDNFLDTEMAAVLAAVDTEVASIKAVTDLLPDAGALTSLATQASVNTIDDFLDTEIAAIKAKTDSLTFTTAGIVDANVQQINDVTITGDGQVGTEFGV